MIIDSKKLHFKEKKSLKGDILGVSSENLCVSVTKGSLNQIIDCPNISTLSNASVQVCKH